MKHWFHMFETNYAIAGPFWLYAPKLHRENKWICLITNIMDEIIQDKYAVL